MTRRCTAILIPSAPVSYTHLLAEEINNMSGSTTSTTTTESTEDASAASNDTASAEADLSTACLSILENGSTSQSGEKTFTTIVTTSYNKATSLSAQLDKMNVMLDLTGASFVDVATNVTETLAQYSNVPMGYPVAVSYTHLSSAMTLP